MLTVHDVQTMWESIEQTVRKTGYAEISVRFVNEWLIVNHQRSNMTTVQELSGKRNLTAVKTEQLIVFRRLMKPLDAGEIFRASGDAICDICRYAYKFHPTDQPPSEFLNVLCNGRRVKL